MLPVYDGCCLRTSRWQRDSSDCVVLTEASWRRALLRGVCYVTVEEVVSRKMGSCPRPLESLRRAMTNGRRFRWMMVVRRCRYPPSTSVDSRLCQYPECCVCYQCIRSGNAGSVGAVGSRRWVNGKEWNAEWCNSSSGLMTGRKIGGRKGEPRAGTDKAEKSGDGRE
ncbi:hypothetical protein K431DRAFT_59250 [Polychaeton citri CBS 116435]|uniref:Uncharacterized protein n=1 Tax=Polychaeton citri CBS 116435 TaxID=1314669 RepID=A0A9P4QBX1_9PEZI|nr:hypothetical protein K431DRAFT_59250 [Polychaeton citri CBS 116435]